MLDAVLALNETDTQVFDFASQAAPPADGPSGHIIVPDAHLLFNGEFQRVGTNDLKIVGDDGASFFIRDYFASDKASHLISPEGAMLNASIVAALAGPLAPGQSAQAGAQPAGQPVIGRVDALSGSCTVIRNGVSVALNAGDTVRKGDVVQTAGGSAVAIVFADGSTFSLNANARMVLDDFVYNAGGAGNSALISLVQGTFSFVAGQVAKTGDMRVDTPVATMGIRGTAVLVEISANDGQTQFSVMTEPDGTTGSFNLYDKTTGTLLGTVSSSQIGWLVTPAGPLQVVAQQVQKTPAQLQQELGIVQQLFTIFNNNQQNPFTPDQNERRGDNPNDPNPQTAQGSGGGSGGVLDYDTSDGSPPGIVNHLPGSGTYQVKLPPLPDGTPPTYEDDTVTVVVTPNAPPIAINDPTGSQGGGDVIENDTDPEGSVIVVTAVQHIAVGVEGEDIPGPVVQVTTTGTTIVGTYGTLTINPDGTYTFSPSGEAFDGLAEGEDAIDRFQYTISDPFGATATAVLSINLEGVNDAPEAVNDTAQNGAEGLPAGNVLLNDTDPDHNAVLSVVSARHVSEGPSNETAATFSAAVSDESANSSGETVIIDGEEATAIEGDYGTLYLKADGSYTFVPNEAFNALPAGSTVTDKFEYTITDGHSETSTSTAVLTITLTGTNSGPSAVTDTDSVTAAGLVDGEWTLGDPLAAGNVLANDTDPDGDTLKVIGVRAGDHSDEDVSGKVNTIVQGKYGYLVLLQNGSYVYTLNNLDSDTIKLGEGETADETFTYTIRDADGNTSTTTLTIEVTGANSAPHFSSSSGYSKTTDEDSAPVTFDLLKNAHDADASDVLSATNIVATAVGPNGIAVTIPNEAVSIVNNEVTIDPSYFGWLNDGQSVVVTINYDLSDGHTTAHNAAKLTINGENEGIQNDTASMGENEAISVNVLANDFEGATGTKTLTALGQATINGPDGADLGNPAIVIQNNQIRITPGTAFDALAVGETATIAIPYTMKIDGISYNAVATITVHGANDAPYFSFSALPDGASSIGDVSSGAVFGGLEAVHLTTSGATQAQIEAFLHLNSGALSTIQADTEDGAAAAFNLKLASNETVTFSWNFASTEYTPFDDYAFFSVSSQTTASVSKLSDIPTIGDSVNDGVLHSSGWTILSYTAQTAGDYRFGIGVMNEGDTAFDSNLYLSGFSGFGFKRTTTESGATETFNLLHGAVDPDANDTLSATGITISGKDQFGNSITLPNGAVIIDGNNVKIDPKFFSYLTNGQSISVVVNYDLTDGHTTTNNSATLIVNGEGQNNVLPSISVASAGIFDTGSSSTLVGVSASDGNAGVAEIFHATIESQHGALKLANPALNQLDEDSAPKTMSFHATLADINTALQQGVTYTDPTPTTSAPPALTDTVKLTIEDSHGGKDSMNFIFNIYGAPGANLTGTSEKDVLFGTAHGETMTGGDNADTFVFARETFHDGETTITVGPGHDTIADFVQGQDKIALYDIYQDFTALQTHISVSQQNGSTTITLGEGSSVTLQNFTGTLNQNDFIFHQSQGGVLLV